MKAFHTRLLSIIFILSLGILVYANTFFCSFHFDDFRFIVDNFAIRNILDLQAIWKFYPCRFVTFLSLALNYHFHHLNVAGYHLFNLAVHLASAFFVWWLTLLTLSTPAMRENRIARHAGMIALCAGLVFVSHPVQTEAVTYIWQRAASLTALFYLASLSFYVKARLLQDDKPHSGLRLFYYILSFLMALVAMFTKETAVTLPLMVLLYEFTFFKGMEGLNIKQLFPFLLTLFVIPLTTLLTHSENVSYIKGSLAGHGGITPIQYILTEFRVIVTYIRLIFLPLNQNLDYDYPISKSIFELPVALSSLLLMVVLFSAQRLFLKYRLVSFSVLWFFLTLLPETCPYPIKDVIFEHRLYLPLVGYSMFLVSSGYYLLGKDSFKFMGMALIMIITCYSSLTCQRNEVWKDERTLWEDVVQKSPHKARGYNGLGSAYIMQGNYTPAMLDFKKAVDIDPHDGGALSNLGASYLHQGNLVQAISDYNKAIENEPDNIKAYYGRATAYCYLKEYDKAWADVRKIKEMGDPFYYERIYKLVRTLSHVVY